MITLLHGLAAVSHVASHSVAKSIDSFPTSAHAFPLVERAVMPIPRYHQPFAGATPLPLKRKAPLGSFWFKAASLASAAKSFEGSLLSIGHIRLARAISGFLVAVYLGYMILTREKTTHSDMPHPCTGSPRAVVDVCPENLSFGGVQV